MTQYLYSKRLSAEVLEYTANDHDWLLTKSVKGEDCVYSEYLANPERLCDTIAYELRRLHETDYTDCPVMEKTSEFLQPAIKKNKNVIFFITHLHDAFA